MPHRAAGIVRFDKPAVGAESLEQPRLEGNDFTAEESRGIDHVAGVGQNKVPALVRFRVALRFPRMSTQSRNGLEVVRHGVAIGRIAIPRFEGHQFSDFVADKFLRESNPRIKTAVVPNLDDRL